MVLFANGIWSFRALDFFFFAIMVYHRILNPRGEWPSRFKAAMCRKAGLGKGKGQATRVAILTLQMLGYCFSTTDATRDEDVAGEDVWAGVCPGLEMRSPGCSSMEEEERSLCDCPPWPERECPESIPVVNPLGHRKPLGRTPLGSKARIQDLTPIPPPNCSMNVSKFCSLICKNGYNNGT